MHFQPFIHLLLNEFLPGEAEVLGAPADRRGLPAQAGPTTTALSSKSEAPGTELQSDYQHCRGAD